MLNRRWVTPLVAGAFCLTAVTGVLLFFHLDSGLNRPAHEWLSWIMLAGVLLHLSTHMGSLRQHLGTKTGRSLIALFAVLLALSFIPLGGERQPPFMASVDALSTVPLSTLAEVARISMPELQMRLRAAGLPAHSEDQTLAQLAGPDRGRRMHILQQVLQPQ